MACAAGATVVALSLAAEPRLNEVMASNRSTLADDDGSFSDWIELYNPGPEVADLTGWYLTDNRASRTKWQFPALILPAGGFVVIFASGKDRRTIGQPLHTNFRLEAGGEYLGLFKSDGETAVSEFAPTLPPQLEDVSYGVIQPPGGFGSPLGYFKQPTPGTVNGGRSALMLPESVSLSRSAGLFTEPFQLALAGAGPGQKIRYVIAMPSSTGANVPDPTAASPEYSTPLVIDTTVIVRAAVFSNDGLVSGRATSAQFLKIGASLTRFTTKLPVIVLDNHGAGALFKDGIDHPAWLYAYDAGAAGFPDAPGVTSAATMAVRGNFSASFPKSSFSVTLLDEQGRNRPQPLVGLEAHEDWALVGPWLTDRSYIRNAFVYALSNRIGRWAPRTRFVETFVNENGDGLDRSDYYGIGVLTERIKIGRDRVPIASLEPEDNGPRTITGGYIVKLDVVPDVDHFSFTTSRGIPTKEDTAVVIYAPNAGKLSTPQRDYIRGYLQRMEDTLFADYDLAFTTRAYLDYIDLPSWVDHHILQLLTGNVDALYRSEYFTKDRGGKLVSGPVWDFDGSMGSGDARNAVWSTWDTAGNVDVWNYGWFGPLTKDPEFMQAWIDRWQALRTDEFSASSLSRLADALAAEVGPEAAARDAARWIDNQSRFPGGFLGEVGQLKSWVTHRAEWIDRQFIAAPKVAASGGTITFTGQAGVQLAYTLDGSDPRAHGGAVAPNTILTSDPLTVPADANVHVRCYSADATAVFPGSPWSSAAASASASPLLPRARLVNLSSRALVGSDADTLIAGVAIADTTGKEFLARAVGPALALFGASHTLPDPLLRIFSADGNELFRNAGWQNSLDAAALPALTRSVGAFPLAPGSADSARIARLPAGGYTVHVSSASGQTGIGLAELYPTDDNGRTLNLSIRAHVRSGEGTIIGGFVVQGPAYKRMLIRAVGPTLAAFGIADTLADPVVTIFSGQTIVGSNDNWSAGGGALVNAASASVGAFALAEGSLDSGLLVTLPPGAYTVEVAGKDNAEGVALLEIYAVP
ncbi:CotH kinase family protein [Horticoccus sp. 23ND18S-11]|uniref:CotH kinase family protein n=1 Tax=Horticoccus sp. 23ND18S-11 TaxID=3391832 RepID=UPI0039C9DA09